MRKTFSFVVVMLFIFVLLSPFVYAAGSCDNPIVDQANIFGTGYQQVSKAVNDLIVLGADVRVMTVASRAPYDSLEKYEKAKEAECGSWVGTDGLRKSNLIVLMVAVNEHETVIFYGNMYKPILESNYQRIQVDLMNGRFRSGDFAGGFVAGLNEITRLVNLQLHPATAVPVQSQPQVVVIVPTSAPREATPPPDLSGLWRVMMFVAIAAVVLGGSFALYKLITSLVGQVNRKRTEQQHAKLAKQDAANLIGDLPARLELFEVKIGSVEKTVSSEDLEPLKGNVERAKALYDSAIVSFGGLDHSAGDPERDLSFEQYEAIAKSYGDVVKTLRLVDSTIKDTEKQAEALRALADTMPDILNSAMQFIDQAFARVESVSRSGFKMTTSEERMRKAKEQLKAAGLALSRKQFNVAKAQAKAARESAEEAASQAEGLQKQRESVLVSISTAQTRVEQVKRTIVTARGIFEEISSRYADSSWRSVAGNGTEAENRVNWSLQAIQSASDLSSMERQGFDQASQSLSQIDAWLAEAESFMRSIVALKKNLDTAKRDAPGEIQAAQTGIQAARGYIAQYDDDIRESLEDDLTSAEQVLAQAQQALNQQRPDYLDIVKLARRANISADKILEQARSEHDTVVRLKEKAASCLRDATAAVSKAAEYIEDHESDVESGAKSHLRDARANLVSAQEARSLPDRISYSEEAEKEADFAYRDAQSDVDDAQKARRPVVVVTSTPSYTTTYHEWGTTRPSVPSYHSSRPSGGSQGGGGGGGTKWGVGGGGGGGGTKWGSGGGGGGGGTKW